MQNKIKRRAEEAAKANVTTAVLFGAHFRWDYLPYFELLHDHIAATAEEFHKYGIELYDPPWVTWRWERILLTPFTISQHTRETPRALNWWWTEETPFSCIPSSPRNKPKAPILTDRGFFLPVFPHSFGYFLQKR